MGDDVLRIANSSGFYGDRLHAPREMLEDGPVDVLTGDYLAELTMLILWRNQQRDGPGYARTFLRQMDDCLTLVADRGVRVVTNAGGLAPAALADALRESIAAADLDLHVAHLDGDDLLDRLDALQADGEPLANLDTGATLADDGRPALTANAYLGGWGIARALDEGADVVVCPRVADASLAVGPAAHHFGWDRDDWDALAGAVVAGHLIECGAQVTGGNYSFFRDIPGLEHPGFPVAELHADGGAVVTKHPGTGGAVTVGTTTAQLLYEIQGPRYLNPDVTARLDTVQLEQVADDRVAVSGVAGEPPPERLKVGINLFAGFRNSMTFLLTGLDVPGKAELLRRTIDRQLDADALDALDLRLIRSDHPDAADNAAAVARLRVTGRAAGEEALGRRRFTGPLVELALASCPGLTMEAPPSAPDPYGVHWPTLVDRGAVDEQVVLADGTRHDVDQTPGRSLAAHPARVREPAGPDTGSDPGPGPAGGVSVPLGRLVGARSGDKGGDANVGVWARREELWPWLERWLTVDRLRSLIPETADLPVDRHPLPNLRAINLVVHGLLGEGVAASTRPDPQAKGLGEYLRSRHITVPVGLLGRG